MSNPKQIPLQPRVRERLIAEHVPMARRIARKMGRCADPSMHEDLESSAMIGLVEAANRYDSQRNEPFAAFAYRRIRGAVIDSLRKSDLLPRRTRVLANRAQRAIGTLEQKLGRAPEEAEVSEELGVSMERYQRDVRVLSEVCFVELAPDFAEAGVAPEEEMVNRLERQQLIERVAAALAMLPERDRRILNLYYVDELTYLEIGRMLGVSEARICQLHGRAIRRVRKEIGLYAAR